MATELSYFQYLSGLRSQIVTLNIKNYTYLYKYGLEIHNYTKCPALAQLPAGNRRSEQEQRSICIDRFSSAGAKSCNIEKAGQVTTRDPLVDHLFENLVVLEALKNRYDHGMMPNLYFFRDSRGHEIDLLYKSGSRLTGVEIKAAAT